MLIKKQVPRCSECNKIPIPNPMLRDRQVTCGDPECQRLRHANRCHEDRATASAETWSNFYQDHIIPYRQSKPWYQRWWRMKNRLREIREKMDTALDACLPALKRLSKRAQALKQALRQAPENTSEKANVWLQTANQILSLFEQLQVLLRQLPETP